MSLWLEKTGAQEIEAVRAGDQSRRRCLVAGSVCIFENVTEAPAPTVTTAAGRRIMWVDD